MPSKLLFLMGVAGNVSYPRAEVAIANIIRVVNKTTQVMTNLNLLFRSWMMTKLIEKAFPCQKSYQPVKP